MRSSAFSPAIVVDERTELGISLFALLLVIAAAYYTGTTGNWVPLLSTSLGHLCIVLFVTSE